LTELRRVLLVGFMGAGKSSSGRALATALRWRFVDFDDEIEAAAGATVAEIFERDGEGRFRALEAEAAERLLRQERVVLGSGGGWAAAPGRLGGVPPGTATVWLQVSPESAVRRASAEAGRRPLLAGPDPVARAAELLAERAPRYGAARWAVDTEGRTVEDVAARILEILTEEYPEIGKA
jgi:shikimate kinase